MITPTVGRVLWFYKCVPGQGHKGPLAAHVCKVHSEYKVNLMVIDEDGNPRSEKNVFLSQGDDDNSKNDYCAWMPYQQQKAAKGDNNSESAEPRPEQQRSK